MDIFEHIEEYLENEKAIILLCPPTYKGGYEKFFYCGEALSWKEPAYRIFDPKTGVSKVMDDICRDAKCLVLCYAETKAGQCPGHTLFSRAESRSGVNSYLTINDPCRAAYILREKNATRRSELPMQPLKYPILSDEHEITPESIISLYEIENANALYYRRLWTHNFSGSVSAFPNFAVVVDGFLCGVFGFNSMNASMFSSAADGKMGLWISYSIAAPVRSYRIIRLNTLVSLCRSVVETGQPALVNQRIEGIYTTMITPKPNSMIHRGIMKLIRREKMNQLNNKLVYYADILEKTPQEAFVDWLKKEQERKLVKNREVEDK
jgi:hypothetical protein